MKKNFLYLTFVAIPFVFACNQSNQKSAVVEKDSVFNKSCYLANFEKDIASLQVNNLASGKVSGTLVVNYAEKPKNTGTIEGKFSGDTLLVDYRFKTGTDTVSIYTNPLAFLKKDGKLIMGVGQIETTLGHSSFVKGKAINYEIGKFTFEPKDCN